MGDNDTSAGSNPYSAPLSNVADVVPEGAVLATRLERFLAAIIDGIIQACVLMVPAFIIFGGWMGYVGAAAASPYMFKIVGTLIGFVAFLVINGYFLARDAQTIGKKAMSIKIVRTDGSKADFARIVVWRQLPIYVCQAIPFIGGVLCLIDLLCIFRDSRRCLHDDIGDTKVVKV